MSPIEFFDYIGVRVELQKIAKRPICRSDIVLSALLESALRALDQHIDWDKSWPKRQCNDDQARQVVRTLSIDGCPTEISLEQAFWSKLDSESKNMGISVEELCERMLSKTSNDALASNLRVSVLETLSAKMVKNGK